MSGKTDSETIEAAENLLGAANSFSFQPVTFAETVRREHRTIQQSVGRAMFQLIQQWALDAETGNYDLRNEQTVKSCKAIVDSGAINAGVPYI
tara:strand:+ start:352 stop:630 length:279 start_codon:yes stop_codon:yes gene_type:complete